MASQRRDIERHQREATEAQQSLRISFERLVEEKKAEYEQLVSGALGNERQLENELVLRSAGIERLKNERSQETETARKLEADFKAMVENFQWQMQIAQNRQTEEKLDQAVQYQEDYRQHYAQDMESLEDKIMRGYARLEEAKRRRRGQYFKGAVGLLGVLAGTAMATVGGLTLNPVVAAAGGVVATGSVQALTSLKKGIDEDEVD